MSYYTDLDEDHAMDEEIREFEKMMDFNNKIKQDAFNKAVQREVARQLKTASLSRPENKNNSGKTITVKCKNCGDSFIARVADRNRGWARFCSKSCKAKAQEKRTGQYSRYIN